MKRIVTLLLAGLMLLALASCGPTKTPPPAGEGDATKKTLRVAMECAYAPYNWNQPTDANGAVKIKNVTGYAYGYDVMMAKLLAEKLGYELEIQALGWDGIIPAIQSGSVDIAICGQSITPERLELVDFTSPYYYASIVVLVPENSKYANATSVAELDGASVTSQMSTIWNNTCVPQIPNAKPLNGQKDAPAMLAALSSGRVEMVITDQPTGLAAKASTPGLKMLEFEGDGAFKVESSDINIGISTKKGNTELTTAINAILDTMTEDDFKAMMNDAIKVQPIQNASSDDAGEAADAGEPETPAEDQPTDPAASTPAV